jgi:sRNA-binding protein
MMEHPKTTIPYRPTRTDSENVIRMLCDHYPKCFFEDPKQRRPLKQDIATDIIADPDFNVVHEGIAAALDWYKQHIGYRGFAMSNAGARRIDLDGREVGTVTEQEAIAARQQLNDYHEERNEKAATSPTRILGKMRADGQISDCGVKKLDAPPPVSARSKAAVMAPEFAALYEMLASANAAIVNITDPELRAAMAKTSLDVVIKKFQQVRSELEAML